MYIVLVPKHVGETPLIFIHNIVHLVGEIILSTVIKKLPEWATLKY